MQPDDHIPVIAIDGPSASGKGTVAQGVAQALRFHYLDSGALYRLVALSAVRQKIALDNGTALARLAGNLPVRFEGEEIWLGNERVTDAIRTEACSAGASLVAAIPEVRQALLARQRGFRRRPGLVADGRDMGSVVFPDAVLKIFLTASPEVRVQRRYKQLMGKGLHATIPSLLQDILGRDVRDSERAVAPLQQGANAILLDTTHLNIDQAVETVLRHYRGPKP